MEGVCAGVSVIAMFVEQFYNEKLIVQVLKIGITIGVDVCMQWGEEDNGGVYVKREDIYRGL